MNMWIEHGAIRRGASVVLQPATLELPDAGTIGVIGANGAGKSTLFMALAGLLRNGPSALATAQGSLFYMPQTPALPSWLTAGEVARLFGQDLHELMVRCSELRLGELGGVRTGRLSGGQRQVLFLALALNSKADMLLLDEPVAHLDLPRRYAALRMLASTAGQLRFVSAQSTADVVDCCDWYIVLRAGAYVFNGPVEALLGTGWRTDATRQARLEERLLELSGFAPK
jgi:ABC-2 type transport system ATP-binding protein